MSEQTEPWWVFFERQYRPDLAVGPYADQAAADQAVDHDSLIDALACEDCLDCWTEQGPVPDGFETLDPGSVQYTVLGA